LLCAALGLERCAGGFIHATLALLEGDPDFDLNDYLSSDDDEEEDEYEYNAYDAGQISELQSKFLTKSNTTRLVLL
jgi:hypothetical protein